MGTQKEIPGIRRGDERRRRGEKRRRDGGEVDRVMGLY